MYLRELTTQYKDEVKMKTIFWVFNFFFFVYLQLIKLLTGKLFIKKKKILTEDFFINEIFVL